MPLPHELVPADISHSWRYAGRDGKYPAPEGIRVMIDFIGPGETRQTKEHNGRTFYKFSEGFFSVHDPANGGFAVSVIERGLINRIEIAAI